MRKFLIFMVFFMMFDIFGLDSIIDNSINDISKEIIDEEPTKQEIEALTTSREYFDDHSNEGEGEITNTRNTSYYNLKGIDLYFASFIYPQDELSYKSDLLANYYAIQGLSIDNNNNFLMTLYYKSGPGTKNSILIRYNPNTNTIIKIYDLKHSEHVGGIGYYHVNTYFGGVTNSQELFFISRDNNSVDLFCESNSSRSIYLKKNYPIKHPASTISTSYSKLTTGEFENGYLWVGEFYDEPDYDDGDNELTGYKIQLKYPYGRWEISLGVIANDIVTPAFSLIFPVERVQGIYCDYDPLNNNKINFYLSTSYSDNNYTIYQATMTFKDEDSNGTIGSGVTPSNEYYWEAAYSPYTHSDPYTKIHPGLEGIVKRYGELWVANEVTNLDYCFSWSSSIVDCDNELLRVNPIIKDTEELEVFPSGSINFTGAGINDFGRKLLMVFAQNKNGEFYYSIGKLSYRYTFDFFYYGWDIVQTMSVFLESPSDLLPTGYQQPTTTGDKVRVFIEDIKGIYLLNLPDDSSTYDSDDWYINKLKLTYDELYFTPTSPDLLYDETFYPATELGDNIGDYKAIMFAFDPRWGTNKTATIKRVNSSNTYGELNYLYEETRACYNASNTTDLICINHLKSVFELYVECDSYTDFDFINYMNSSSLDKLNDIEFDCN